MATQTLGKIDAQYLAAALLRAMEAAYNADPGEGNDGGSCNLDTPVLKLPRVPESVIEEAEKLSGIRFGHKMGGWWKGFRFVFTPMLGQGNRRTAMSEAAYKSLKSEFGDFAQHWQQMD